VADDPAQQAMRRVTTDQAGMSYGMSGDIPKARAQYASIEITERKRQKPSGKQMPG
jgi:hypothetical protein